MRNKVYRQLFGLKITQSEIKEFDDSIFELISILAEVDNDLSKKNENNRS